jgi:prolyl oligopeptidase
MEPFVRRILIALAAASLSVMAHAQTPPADPYIWLEDANGARAMDWVKAENTKTTGVLEKDPHFAGLYADALTIAQAKDRIPGPELVGDQVYNFWRDQTHVRGIWRKTSKADYANADPHWTTVLDLDALSTAEHANWVWEGANCLQPEYRRCLVNLSDGGEDAVTVREFDLTTGGFVPGGFVLPHSKQNVDWLDKDTLLVARDWGPGTMTESSYAFVVKSLKRGQSLDQAVEIYRGTAKDVSVAPTVLRDAEGHRVAIIQQGLDFWRSKYFRLTDKGITPMALPEKVNLQGLLHGSLVFTTQEAWRGFKAGDLLSVDPAGLMADSAAPSPRALIFEPGPRQSLDGVVVTRNRIEAAIYDNVRGSLVAFEPTAKGWSAAKLPVAPNSSVTIGAASDRDDTIYYYVQSFLDPTTLYQADAATGAAHEVKSTPPKFDASKDVAEQFEATSSDGTKVPYFVVHPKGMALNGQNPTILYAYGGFQNSLTPSYSANIGKLWLERGGVWVLANIRGGGEFGPAWHEAGLKTHRQLIYDDFAAVARDLDSRGITGPRHLGIQGGSNGGLLMGVEFTQHPELWRAVDIQVPLLDMLRYEQIAAGASWVGEYGSVSVPEERAFLAKISPYNNLHADMTYPEPLIWTTTKDDRVGPQHARKFAARLAEMGKPYLFYEVIEGGHGSGANLNERAHTTALEFDYFIRKLMD